MSARQAENELEFLKTALFEKWWFKVKEPSESFTKLFNSLIDKRLFHIKLIRFMPGSGLLSVGQVTEIDEEGMWLLSHLFSNWQEMYEQTVPPWKRETEQGEPEQEKVCCECGVDEFNDLERCDNCKQWVCDGCYASHSFKHLHSSKQEPSTCARCSMGVFPGTGVTCPACQHYFHSVCYHAFHAETHAPKHANARTSFHFDNIKMNWRIDEEVLNSLRDTMAWANSDEAKQQAEKLKRQQEEAERKGKEEAERKARAREQAQRMYEKQQRDQEEFYKNLFGNMGHFSFKNNRNGTYTHTWDFGHWESDDGHQNAHTFTAGSVPNTLEAAFSYLGLSTRATVQEVKRAFRRKAKEAHPDTGGSNEEFKALNEAYQKALAEAQRNER